MKIIINNRSAKVVDRIKKGLLFAFLMLGAGFTGLQAQNVQPANFYNLLNGEATNEITLDPGDTFTWTMGINSDGGMDGVTATYYFPFEQMQEDNELATDLIPQFIFPVQNIVENETGYVTFTKTAVGTFITGSQDIAQWTYTIGDDVPLGTVINIEHVTDPAVVLMSNIVYIGNELLAPEDAPGITINVGEPVLVDCPELGLNIGDACDDGDDMTENDVVDGDCNCAGTPIINVPANDNCTDAEVISCGQSIEGTTMGATESDFPTPDCANGNENDVFYSLDAEPGTEYSITISGDDYDAILVVYSGSCASLEDLNEIACSDLGLEDGDAETVVFTVDEAQSVIIRTYDWNSNAGSFTMDVSCLVQFDCPELEANIGDSCDDNNLNTNNDVVDENCNCVGAANVSLLTLECGGQVIQITGALAGSNAGGNATSETRTIYGFMPDNGNGTPIYTGTTWPYVIIEGGLEIDLSITATLTTNADGVLLVNGWPAYQFSGDASSTDFGGTFGPWNYFLPDGSLSQDACEEEFDCPALGLNIGDACDDGDEDTENDIVTDACECVGTPVLVFDCPALGLNIGDACDDGDENTEDDMVDADCNCTGTPVEVFDCPALGLNIGDACDDGDDRY